eukprot:m.394382 g.394382  ORF g.394382 m.394382 type:complete len:1241 (+) comp28343_c4_seq5:276-3998(+)
MPTPSAHAMADKAAALGKKPAHTAGKAAGRNPPPILKGPFARMQHVKKSGSSPNEVTPEDRRKDATHEHVKARKALPLAASLGARSSPAKKRTKKTTPFSLFCKHNLDRIIAANPGLGIGDQMDKLNDEWGVLPMAEKRHYEAQAEQQAAEATVTAKAKSPAKTMVGVKAKPRPKAKAAGVKKPSGANRKRPAADGVADASLKRARSADTILSSTVSPFKIFREENRHAVKEQYPTLTKEERAAKLKEQYRALDAEALLRYKEQAAARNIEEGRGAAGGSPLKHHGVSHDASDEAGAAESGGPAQPSPSSGTGDASEYKPKGMKQTSPKKPTKGVAITDFFRKSNKKMADIKPLTTEQQAKVEKGKQKIRLKLMSKKEKEEEKIRVKEEKQKERDAIKQRREAEKKKRREEEKRKKQAEIERQKPREDTKLLDSSKMLPTPTPIDSRLPSDLFSDVVMLAEFIRTFASAFVSLPRERLTARELEDVLMQNTGGEAAHSELLTLVTCFVGAVFEVSYGPDSCAVDSVLGLQLKDLPVNVHTMSDVLRLYLVRTEYAAAERDEADDESRARANTIKMLETSELAMLSPRQIIDILLFLSNKAFSNAHFMDKVEDAIERIPQIRKEQLEIDREEAREKKAVEEAAKKASKGDADAVVNPVDADAALAALLFEKENSRSSRRVTRGLEETPQEKAAREAFEEIERKQREVEERRERRITLDEELVEQKNYLKGRLFGFDRNWSQYRLLDSLPGLVVQQFNGELCTLDSVEDFDALLAALNERGLREKALKAELLENRHHVLRHIKAAVKHAEMVADGKASGDPADALTSDSRAAALSAASDPSQASNTTMVIDRPATSTGDDEASTHSGSLAAATTPVAATEPVASTDDSAMAEDPVPAPIGVDLCVAEASVFDGDASSLTTVDGAPGSPKIAGLAVVAEEVRDIVPTAPAHRGPDAWMLSAVKGDVTLFFDKINEGGFGVPNREQWMKAIESATSAADVGKCLLELEEYIELRFLQKPLGQQRETVDEELTETVQIVSWRQYANEATSSSKVSLLYELLYESIRWDKSAKSIKCKVCRRSTDEQELLLCDGCNHGFHTFCLKPKLFEIPQGDWFCTTCKPPALSGRQAKRNAMALMMEGGDEGSESDAAGEADGVDNYVDSLCSVCTQGGEVLCCDTCPLVYHLECVGLRRIPRGVWQCDACQNPRKRSRGSSSSRPKPRASSDEDEEDEDEDDDDNDDDDFV